MPGQSVSDAVGENQIDQKLGRGAIWLSVERLTTEEEVDQAAEAFIRKIKK